MITRERFFESVMPASVDYNLQNPNTLGVGFYKADNKWNAVLASQFYSAEIRNVPEPESDFYSFFENRFTDYRYPASIDNILKVLYADIPVVGTMTTRYSNLMNYLTGIPKIKRKKSRVILRRQDEIHGTNIIIMNFKTVDGKRLFYHDKVAKPFRAIEDAPIPESKIVDGRFYQCVITGEDANNYFVQAVTTFGKFVFDFIYTQGLYNNEQMPEVYPAESFPVNTFNGDLEKVHPVHIDTEMLYTVMKIFGILSDNSIIEFTVGEDPKMPIMIHGKNDDVEIFARVMPLDPDYGKQRR